MHTHFPLNRRQWAEQAAALANRTPATMPAPSGPLLPWPDPQPAATEAGTVQALALFDLDTP